MFPKRLKELRAGREMSQQELADALHIARSTLASYEVGDREPDFETAGRLADFFGVSVDYLLGHSNAATVGEQPAAYQANDLAARWPDLSPDRRRTAMEWEVATKAAGMPTMFGHDLTDDEFDAILDVLKQAIAAFAGLAEKIKAAFPHK